MEHITAALGGESRPSQLEMVERIESALASDTPVAIAAPTGTGKSFGYLVPAVLSDETTVVVTSTKALQDQLDRKDLPFLARHLDHEFSWALLKGRSNYACLAKATELQFELETGHGADTATALLDWLDETETGDEADLPSDLEVNWSGLSMSSDECPGARKCSYGTDCFYERARLRAQNADIVVTNTAMYGAHLASDGAVLPEHDVVIIDEAHAAEDALRGAITVSIDAVRLESLASRISALDNAAADTLRTSAAILDAALVGQEPGWLRKGPAAIDTIERALQDVASSVAAAVGAVRKEQQRFAANEESDAKTKIERLLAIGTVTEAEVQRVRSWATGDVAWIETDRGRTFVRLAPLDVAPLLETSAWSQGVNAVLTSATLDRYTAARLGLSACEYLALESPFDHRANALLYVPELPDPRRADFRARADKEIARCITAAGGRTLVLFTSFQAMRASAAAVEELVDVPILVQGTGSKAGLLESFLDDEAACLFATMSFWQGIDPAGRTCSVVIVDKIPFSRPDDPVVSAQRDAAGPRAFTEVDLPRASTLLAQGVGRLIRSRDDRGVVCVLDTRLAEKSYRRQLLDRLPPMRRTRTFADVEAFLAEVTSTAD